MTKLSQALRWTVREHWWIPPLALAAAVAAGWAGAMAAKPLYVRWRTERAVVQARKFLRTHDLPRASVALQVALRGRPTLAVYQALGDFDEAAGSDQAITARQLASELRPRDAGLKLAEARTALRFNDLATAREALAALGPAGRATLDYQRTEATYALLAGDRARAARLLAAVEKQNPADDGVRLLDDSLNIRNTDPATAEAAKADLRGFSADSPQHVPALRVLLADAFARGYRMAAGDAGRALAADNRASFSDLLDAASAEAFASPASGADAPLLVRIRARASASPSAAALYGRWLLLHQGPDEVAAWLGRLPPAVAATPAVTEVRAEVAAARGDWRSLQSQLEAGAWGPIFAPGLDLGFAARILRQKGYPDLTTRVWHEALDECASSQASLRALARLADIWKWPEGMQAALFATVRNFPTDDVAAQRLIGLLRARRDSRAFLELLTLRKDSLPPSDRRLADWALVSLLVEPTTEPDAATRTLDELYAKQPGDPYFVTDHAFALWELGRVREACAVLDRLAPDDRFQPLRTPYLAVIYASAGRLADARAELARAPRRSTFLPEEAALLARATTVAVH